MSIQEAQVYVQSLGIKTRKEFYEWNKSGDKPPNFPSSPDKVYKENWTNWGSFLGTGNSHKKEWMSIQEAQALVQSLGIKNYKELTEWIRSDKRPENFPSSPHKVYKEWEGLRAVLGSRWISIQEAQVYVQSLGIRTQTEFYKWAKSGDRPSNFPSNPQRVYKENWTNWGSFLGTGNFHKKEWMSIQEAQALVQSLGIKTQKEFYAWIKSDKRPKNFPSSPHTVYTEWEGLGPFLGTGNFRKRNKGWMSIQEAQALIQKLGIMTPKEFYNWSSSEDRPSNFPSNPRQVYKEKWINWGSFLRNGNSYKKEWMSIQEAQALMQELGIKTQAKFYKWAKSGDRPPNFPSSPQIVYKEKWINWRSFLGTENSRQRSRINHLRTRNSYKKEWMSIQEAQALMQELGIKTQTEFREWSKSGDKPPNFPSSPETVYKEKWINWRSFLGTENFRQRSRINHLRNRNSYKKEWMSIQEAQALMQELGIKTQTEFREWSKSGDRPSNFPSNPQTVYKEKWINWRSFLGTENSRQRSRINHKEDRSRNIKAKEQRSRLKENSENIPIDPEKANVGERGKGDIFSEQESFDQQMSYEELKSLVQSKNIKTRQEFYDWTLFEENSKNIPIDPEKAYKENWEGWDIFFGIKPSQKLMDYEEAKYYVREITGLKTVSDFIQWLRSDERPENLPLNPYKFYTEWTNIYDFLGIKPSQKLMDYEEAKYYVREITELKTFSDFIRWLRSDERPENFPAEPSRVYIEWKSFDDFLGIQWPSYEEARSFNRIYSVFTKEEYYQLRKTDRMFEMAVPPNPIVVYGKNWKGWDEYMSWD